MPSILIADKIADAGLERLRAAENVTFDVRHGLSPDELASTIGEYDGIVIRSGVTITADTLANPGRLSVIARAGVGVDNVDLDAARARGILVLNTPEANTISTAEHAFAMLLAMHRKIPDAHQHVKSGQWRRAAFQGSQLAGRTLGIVGLGRIGLAVAQRALAFDMKVIACDPFVKQETALDGAVVMAADLAELLSKADSITLHAAVPGQSKPLIGKDELARMKPGARLVNCARGALVDEQALADALSSGHLAGAAIDVYQGEPPTDSPLLAAPNIVLTPHLGASTAEAQEQVSVDAVDAVLAYLLDGEIRSAVNVSGMPKSLSPRARAFVDLASRMGALLSVWFAEGLGRICVKTYGESLKEVGATLAWQSVASMLTPHLEERVNLVNVKHQAEKRGITVDCVSHSLKVDYPELLTVGMDLGKEHYEISGTVLADGRPRILAINDYRMEMVPERAIVLIFNDDQPGVIGLVGKHCGDAGINIADMALSRRGQTALMVLKLDEPMPDELLDRLAALNPPIHSVRAVTLPPVETGSL